MALDPEIRELRWGFCWFLRISIPIIPPTPFKGRSLQGELKVLLGSVLHSSPGLQGATSSLLDHVVMGLESAQTTNNPHKASVLLSAQGVISRSEAPVLLGKAHRAAWHPGYQFPPRFPQTLFTGDLG